MKKFFNSMEEKFVFPISRRTWQICALMALVGLSAFIVWFLINSFPASKDKVVVKKTEVVENRIDTTTNVADTKEVEIGRAHV